MTSVKVKKTATEHINKGHICINFIKFRAEEYKPPIRLTSCYKCQNFGHISKQCKSDKTLCPKCGRDDHTKDQNNKLMCTSDKKHCVNCNKEHSSAYAGCEKKKKILQDLKNKQRNQLNIQQATNTPKQVTKKISYANAVLGHTTSHVNITQPLQQEIAMQNETIEQLNNRINQLEEKLEKAEEENSQLRSALQKITDIENKQWGKS